MSTKTHHPVTVAGITRQLPLFEVAPGLRIAVFNMLGDTLITKATAAALAEKLQRVEATALVTAEAKSIPLAYEMSALMGLPYVVLRKAYKSYMGEAHHAETLSITTGKPQTLYLDEKDLPHIAQKNVILVDDVISTGSTLKGMLAVIEAAGGKVAATTAVFTEGDQDWSGIIALGNLPLFKES